MSDPLRSMILAAAFTTGSEVVADRYSRKRRLVYKKLFAEVSSQGTQRWKIRMVQKLFSLSIEVMVLYTIVSNTDQRSRGDAAVVQSDGGFTTHL